MKIAVVTAITGGMDALKLIPDQSVPYHRFIFTDSDVPDHLKDLNKRTQALYFKQQTAAIIPGYDVYIWLDGKIQVLAYDFIQQCIDALGTGDLAVLKHGDRSCVYEELDYIIDQMAKGSGYLCTRYADRDLPGQKLSLQRRGYPIGNRLNDCSIIVSRNSDAVKMVMNEWWVHCLDQKAFDQVWLKYYTWAYGVPINDIVFKPASFKLVKHLKVR